MDERLTGNPQITYFKSVMRRHTPFSKGIHVYNKYTIFPSDKNPKKTWKISYGSFDLITDLFLENKIIGLQSGSLVYANIGNTIIKDITFKVGSTELYKVDGLFMEAQAELENPYVPSLFSGSSVPPIMTGNDNGPLTCNTGSHYNINTFSGGVSGSFMNSNGDTDTFYTYPNFYFSRSYGNAFPILAINNHTTELIVQYNPWLEFSKPAALNPSANTLGKLESNLNIEYVNLSDEERHRIINYTEHYIYYDISEYNYTGSTRLHYPIRQIFFIGTQGRSTADRSASMTISTPYSISKNTNDILFKINGDNVYELSEKKHNLDIYTKHNIYRAGYPGFGRQLISPQNDHIKAYGYWDSIGVHTFCLDPLDQSQPNGHLSANTEILIKPNPNSNYIRIYTENIRFFYIMGGHLSHAYI